MYPKQDTMYFPWESIRASEAFYTTITPDIYLRLQYSRSYMPIFLLKYNLSVYEEQIRR